MDILRGLLHNQVLMTAIFAWLVAQGAKMALLIVHGNFSKQRLVTGGGMPSAHGATVTGLTAAVFLVTGPESPVFALSVFFTIIVLFDAQGVRYTTGLQSKVLNRLRERDRNEAREPLCDQPLEEHIGHTIPELAAGIVSGLLTAAIVNLFY